MKEMKERTLLGEQILRHWREHCPQMVRDLEKQNRRDQALFETQTRTGDLLYELVSVQKMDYHAAWELAQEEWALPRSGKENRTESGNNPPAASPPAGTSGPAKPGPKNSPPRNSKSSTSNRKPRRRRGTSG